MYGLAKLMVEMTLKPTLRSGARRQPPAGTSRCMAYGEENHASSR